MRTAADDWTVHGHFMAEDGDRTALLEHEGRWAILWSYAAPLGPQLVDFADNGEVARKTFELSREYTARRTGLTYDSREDWAPGRSA